MIHLPGEGADMKSKVKMGAMRSSIVRRLALVFALLAAAVSLPAQADKVYGWCSTKVWEDESYAISGDVAAANVATYHVTGVFGPVDESILSYNPKTEWGRPSTLAAIYLHNNFAFPNHKHWTSDGVWHCAARKDRADSG